jgi:predicted O-linked N-acetylglucosamine transferase (SPINDLY family)
MLTGHRDDAIACFRRAIEIQPESADLYDNLGNALKENKQLQEAIAAYRTAIRLNPGMVRSHVNIGNALKYSGLVEEAIVHYRRAIELNPSLAGPKNNLANALVGLGQLNEAIAVFRQAIGLDPNLAEIHCNLGNALLEKRELDEAIVCFSRAINLQPGLAGAHNNLGTAQKETGQLDAAIASYRRATEISPDHVEADSNLLYCILFHPDYTPAMIQDEHRRWSARFAEPLRRFIEPHSNDRNPDRRLRIGYLSPDFRDHVVGQNLLPLFREHDHQRFEVFCYSNVFYDDAMTEQLRQCADTWRNITGESDAHVARQIRDDRIDILIDLTLHMSRNRLAVFAHKPAPIQATFAGYPGSTGLETVDYRITDRFLDPAELDDHFYSEKSVRLPDSFWCYEPLITNIPVNELPAQTTGHVTFGCLNNFCKINCEVLKLWARVLRAVDRSELIVLCPRGNSRERLLRTLKQEEIDCDRIHLVTRLPRREYLEVYNRIDIGLDTFPYNGHTTSLDAIWMGVPVVTLVGRTVVGRAGLSQLENLGLSELATRTSEQYVDTASALAQNLSRLAQLRTTLRQQMETSTLMDAKRFARNIEARYREIWQNWCTGQQFNAGSKTMNV